jgi:hypothetical protein
MMPGSIEPATGTTTPDHPNGLRSSPDRQDATWQRPVDGLEVLWKPLRTFQRRSIPAGMAAWNRRA